MVVSDLAVTDDRSGNSQTTTLEQDEIDSLPDDPDELAEALRQMTGGSGATFQVNGFRGGRLPSREEIRQIRFRTNSFSADNHDAGRTQIEIITRPNVREWSGNANMGIRSRRVQRKNAFAQLETPEQFRRFNMAFRGPLVAGKTSLRMSRRRQPVLRHASHLRAQRRRQHLPRSGAPPQRVYQRHHRHRARADQQPDAAARNTGAAGTRRATRASATTRSPSARWSAAAATIRSDSRSRAWSARRRCTRSASSSTVSPTRRRR